MFGSILDVKSSFKMLGVSFSCKSNWDAYIVSIVKTTSKKIEALTSTVKFLPSEAALIDRSIRCGFAWNTVVM